MKVSYRLSFSLPAILLLMLTATSVFCVDGKKIALVIGNGAYQKESVSQLENPANDARDVSSALQSIGFEVDTIVDGSHEEMGTSIARFSRDLLGAEVGLFYYAGHGVQIDGMNYLIPVDADLPSAEIVKYRAIAADEVLDSMAAAGAALNLFFLDACRDNPLPSISRSLTRGLAAATYRPPETMIVYATSANNVAADGFGRNSPFTRALVKHLPTPGLDVYDLFRNISADVHQATGGTQRPELFGNIVQHYSLVPISNQSVVVSSPVTIESREPSAPPTRETESSTNRESIEQLTAESTKGSRRGFSIEVGALYYSGKGTSMRYPEQGNMTGTSIGAVAGLTYQFGSFFSIGIAAGLRYGTGDTELLDDNLDVYDYEQRSFIGVGPIMLNVIIGNKVDSIAAIGGIGYGGPGVPLAWKIGVYYRGFFANFSLSPLDLDSSGTMVQAGYSIFL